MNSAKEFLEYILNAVKFWIIIQPWERGLRVRAGKRIRTLKGGIYFRIPYVDSFYVQTVRTRVYGLPVQTLTSKDKQTVTLNGAFGYSITDIEQLYNSLYHPEGYFANIAMGTVADLIYTNNMNDLRPDEIEKQVLAKMQNVSHGVKIEYFKLNGFAVVKTYRLIQDHMWTPEGMTLDTKK